MMEQMDDNIMFMDEENEDKPTLCDSLTEDLSSPNTQHNSTMSQTETEYTLLSEETPHESKMSLGTGSKTPADFGMEQNITKCGDNRALIICGPWSVEEGQPKPLCSLLPSWSVEKDQPNPLCSQMPWSVEKDQPKLPCSQLPSWSVEIEKSQPKPLFSLLPPPLSVEKDPPMSLCSLLPSSKGHCSVYEMSQSCTSISRGQHSVNTSTAQTQQSDVDDPCASFLLACLFCQPLDCTLAAVRGCNVCLTTLCACDSATLEPLMGTPYHANCCDCLRACSCLWDWAMCEFCIQATECLDLAMEISQMLFH